MRIRGWSSDVCSSVRRIGAAQEDVVDRKIADAGFQRHLVADRRIVRVAAREAEFEALRKGLVAEDRYIQLGIGFVQVVAADGGRACLPGGLRIERGIEIGRGGIEDRKSVV